MFHSEWTRGVNVSVNILYVALWWTAGLFRAYPKIGGGR